MIHRRLTKRACRRTEDHITAASTAAGNRVALVCSDNQIGQSIAIDVAGTGHTRAAAVTRTLAIDDKPPSTTSNRRQIYRRSRRLAEYHIAAPGIGAGNRVALVCSDNQIGQTIAIDIAGTGNADTALVTHPLAVDDKAAGAGRDRRQVDRRSRRLAEHHIAAPGTAPGSRVAVPRPDNQISQTIAIDIAGTGHTGAAIVNRTMAVDDKAAGTAGDRRQIYRRGRRLAKHHIAAPSTGAGESTAVLCPDD